MLLIGNPAIPLKIIILNDYINLICIKTFIYVLAYEQIKDKPTKTIINNIL